MHAAFLEYRSSLIHYLRGGTGSKLLLCFHGYGESAESFAFLEEPLGEEFTLLAFDLPFHGRTDWKEGLFFDPGDFLSILSELTGMIQPRPRGTDDERIYLLGYSMGGRVALHLSEKIPEKIGKLILLAPDGLKMNGWYWLATQTRPGNVFFGLTMRKPGWFFFFLRMADKLRLVNPSVYKFTTHYIGDKQVREDLYRRWTTMRGFRPGIPFLQALIRENQIPVRLLYGRYDRIIRWETGEKFRRETGPLCKLVILDTGHQLLQSRNRDTLISLLKE